MKRLTPLLSLALLVVVANSQNDTEPSTGPAANATGLRSQGEYAHVQILRSHELHLDPNFPHAAWCTALSAEMAFGGDRWLAVAGADESEGCVHIFAKDGASWREVERLALDRFVPNEEAAQADSDGGAARFAMLDGYGHAVAMTREYLAAGVVLQVPQSRRAAAGAYESLVVVYVLADVPHGDKTCAFREKDCSWVLNTQLSLEELAPDEDPARGLLGCGLALTDTYLASTVGACYDSGSVSGIRIWKRSGYGRGSTWRLHAAKAASAKHYGHALSMTSQLAVLGDWRAGTVEAWHTELTPTWNDTFWQAIRPPLSLTEGPLEENAFFGISVSVGDEMQTRPRETVLAVGSLGPSGRFDPSSPPSGGHVSLFLWDAYDWRFCETQRLSLPVAELAAAAVSSSSPPRFGESVAESGGLLVVAAPTLTLPPTPTLSPPRVGAVFVYVWESWDRQGLDPFATAGPAADAGGDGDHPLCRETRKRDAEWVLVAVLSDGATQGTTTGEDRPKTRLGSSVAIGGSLVAVQDDSKASYVYDLCDREDDWNRPEPLKNWCTYYHEEQDFWLSVEAAREENEHLDEPDTVVEEDSIGEQKAGFKDSDRPEWPSDDKSDSGASFTKYLAAGVFGCMGVGMLVMSTWRYLGRLRQQGIPHQQLQEMEVEDNPINSSDLSESTVYGEVEMQPPSSEIPRSFGWTQITSIA